MNNEFIDEGATGRRSKRNRGLLSCVECHRRKQKCNRLQPCNDCTQRGVPHKCEYRVTLATQGLNSVQKEQGISRKGVKNGRLRRIITGSEVILTPESVDALQNLGASASASASTEPISDIIPTSSFSDWGAGSSDRLDPAQTGDTRSLLAGGIPPGVDFWFLGGLDPFSSLPPTEGEPIPQKLLIFHFFQQLAPWLSSYDDTMTPKSPRVSWFPFAIDNPTLFYATLLGAAVHLDRKHPLGDQRKLIWYKVETMRLANKNLHIPSEGASDQMILVALILLYFNVGGDNGEEYEIHLRGIHQMLKLRGGKERLGMRGMVKNWLDICYGPWVEGWEYGRLY